MFIMRSFIEYESEILPISYIPYAFKCRLILLASVIDAAKLNIAFRDPIPQCHRPHERHNGVYITDSRYIVHYATKHAWIWSLWPCAPWRWLQYDLDGPYTIYPIWETVLHVDEVTNKDDIICVNETLVLFLTSEESYDLIIPKITGPYSRLVLHGYNYTWPQVKRLIHKRVKQVRIMDCIDVDPEEYDDIIDFLLRFSRGFVNK
uniref:DUF3841 domain-containing protein n=1 Tax=Panagrellus redivivus TaxID=6233 RepID=A0A7E4ZX76_PANRE